MKMTYVEVACDNCGQADFYKPPQVDAQAKDNGWIIERRRHFCDENCRSVFLIKREERLKKIKEKNIVID